MNKFRLSSILAIIAVSTFGYYHWQSGSSQSNGSLNPVVAQNQAPPSSNLTGTISSNTSPTIAKRDALQVSENRATNSPSFVTAPEGEILYKSDPKVSLADNAMQFFKDRGDIFGMQSPNAELKPLKVEKDDLGMQHITYQQVYQGLDVFGANLKAHFNQEGNLTAVNGTFVPNINLNTLPNVSEANAMERALKSVDRTSGATPVSSQLLVFRENLVKGTPGSDRLAWQVLVSNGSNVKQMVFVDAHAGKVIDSISAVNDSLSRRVYDGEFAVPPANYPLNPFWVEGNAFPSQGTCVEMPGFPPCHNEANSVIQTTKETYNFFSKTFGRDSIDGHGLKMDGVFDIYDPDVCPNAYWDQEKTNFCPGISSDDIVAHEFGHAYTQYTAGLLYQWQSGALNEAYSDIWGETVDQLNGRGTDSPDRQRTDGSCSKLADDVNVAGNKIGELNIAKPLSIAGPVHSVAARFGPVINKTFKGDIKTLASPNANGCAAISENLIGKIAMIDDDDTCDNIVKVKNAQNRGAIGVVIAEVIPDSLRNLSGVDATITIPAVRIPLIESAAIKAALVSGPVKGSIQPGGKIVDKSYRWLNGEDSAFGVIRDEWNPNCKNHPDKVSDHAYWCFSGDSGGVHRNSGIPNRLYALLTDGSNPGDDHDNDYHYYKNKHNNVKAIGLLKAAHIHFRALSTYLVSTSGFPEFADALTRSCQDLQGVKLKGFDGKRSNESISKNDCKQVAAAIAEVELRKSPLQCNFQPILAKNPPALCGPGLTQTNVFTDGFEGPIAWTVSHEGQTPSDFTERDWNVVATLPNARTGKAFFGPDPNIGTCVAGGLEQVVMHLDSPLITIPAGATNLNLSFDHYVATEFRWDGGNVKISVNGGPFQIIQAADFIYNPYNVVLYDLANDTSDDPIAGQPAFSGTDGGTSVGSWGRSIINLAPYGATPGSTVRLRFDMGNDCLGGVDGWYVDDVNVYQCKP